MQARLFVLIHRVMSVQTDITAKPNKELIMMKNIIYVGVISATLLYRTNWPKSFLAFIY